MKNIILLILFFVALNSYLTAQQTHIVESDLFDGPEAIIYDSELKLYYIGNAGDGKILKMDSLGLVEPFIDSIGVEMVMSFEIIGDSLFASTNYPSTLTCLNRYTGDLIYQLDMDSIVQSFSQTVVDRRNNNIYIVVQQGEVYKVIPDKAQIWKFADAGVQTSAQGIEIDTLQNQLMIFSWSLPQATFINLSDSTDVSIGPNIGSYQNTGSVTAPDGYVYLSTWSGHQIRKFHKDSIAEAVSFCNESLYKPVGITYNLDKKQLGVCNYGNNTVTIVNLTADTLTGMSSYNLQSQQLRIYNPINTRGVVIECQNPVERISSVYFYNSVGQVVQRVWEPYINNNQSIHIDASRLPAGFYIVTVSAGKQIIGSSKIVFQ